MSEIRGLDEAQRRYDEMEPAHHTDRDFDLLNCRHHMPAHKCWKCLEDRHGDDDAYGEPADYYGEER